jgi:hypothetical protein
MITTFQESSCGMMEMARSVGHPLMSSNSSLMADSAGFRWLLQMSITIWPAERDHLWLSARAHVFEQRA